MTDRQFLIITVLLALSVMICRYLPFIIFKDDEKLPDIIDYLGKALPSAMIGMLVVYSFKDYDFSDMAQILPAVIASAVTVIVHLFKRNTIISVLSGTLVYMILLNVVF